MIRVRWQGTSTRKCQACQKMIGNIFISVGSHGLILCVEDYWKLKTEMVHPERLPTHGAGDGGDLHHHG